MNDPIGTLRCVCELGDEYEFVDLSQDLEHIAELLALPGYGEDWSAAFVRYGEAEILEVWVMSGTVPYLDCIVELVFTAEAGRT